MFNKLRFDFRRSLLSILGVAIGFLLFDLLINLYYGKLALIEAAAMVRWERVIFLSLIFGIAGGIYKKPS